MIPVPAVLRYRTMPSLNVSCRSTPRDNFFRLENSPPLQRSLLSQRQIVTTKENIGADFTSCTRLPYLYLASTSSEESIKINVK